MSLLIEVSVVIPYYNRESTIIRAVKSVLNQTYRNFELILIDDGSDDNGHKIVDEYIKNVDDINIVHIYQDNSGPSKARNYGIKIAKGKYIAFLDSDDSWKENKLMVQIDFLRKNKDCAILGSDFDLFDKKAVNNEYNVSFSNFYKMLFKNFFILPTVIVKKEIFSQANYLFDEKKKYAEDQLFFLRISRDYKGARLKLPLASLYKGQFGEGGLSGDIIMLEKNELENFRILYKENKNCGKKINFVLLVFMYAFSIIKFIRRFVLSKWYRLVKH